MFSAAMEWVVAKVFSPSRYLLHLLQFDELQKILSMWLKKSVVNVGYQDAIQRLRSIPVTVDWEAVTSYLPKVPTSSTDDKGPGRVDWYVARLVAGGNMTMPAVLPVCDIDCLPRLV